MNNMYCLSFLIGTARMGVAKIPSNKNIMPKISSGEPKFEKLYRQWEKNTADVVL